MDRADEGTRIGTNVRRGPSRAKKIPTSAEAPLPKLVLPKGIEGALEQARQSGDSAEQRALLEQALAESDSLLALLANMAREQRRRSQPASDE